MLAVSATLGLGGTGLAQSSNDAPAAVVPAAVAPAATAPTTATPSQDAAAPTFTRPQLEKLLAPYALYPDDLLAQVLPSCAYPIQIVQLSRWLAKNKAAVAKGDYSGVDSQSWEPSVKALARFGTVVDRLNQDLDATTDLGEAFVNQPEDVASVIQAMRVSAQKAGSLKTTRQQRVTTRTEGDKSYVVIEPAEPGLIYVPSYDPAVVYGTGTNVVPALITFGLGIAAGIAIDNAWDWRRGWAYPPRWAGYPGYRPGYPGGGVNRPWRPDPGYRPGGGGRPGAGNRPGIGDRPGIGNRPGAGNGPGVGNGPGAGNRPGAGNGPGAGNRPGNGGNRPGAGNRPNRPGAGRPARDTAFSDARLGGASRAAANRGMASRQSFNRGGGGGPAFRGGGGMRRGGFGGGGGGGRAHRRR